MGKWRYGIVLDAGSSGTRIYIYRWLKPKKALQGASGPELKSLPVLETKKRWTKKKKPGIATYGSNPKAVGPSYLQELFDHATENVPADAIAETPLFLLATAGVRLLPDTQKAELLREICAAAQKTNFLVPDCDLHVQVIPGETEGLYGWTAANYLLGGFDSPEDHQHGKGHHTYGFLDMGGASAQIAFAPNTTESKKHANDLKLMRLRTIDGSENEYKVFVTTWLGFGANEARRRYVESLINKYGGNDIKTIKDPCLPRGASTLFDSDLRQSAKNPLLEGMGDFKQCLKETVPLLDKEAPCPDEPCLFHGVHIPAIDFDVNHFVGVSEYWHTTHEIFEMDHRQKAYDFNTYQGRVLEFCSKDWKTIQKGVANKQWKKVTEETAREVCFKASWLINVLHEGIGIPRIGMEDLENGHNGTKEVLEGAKKKGFTEPFKPYDKIEGTDVSWTLGKMVLYASSQVTPLGESSLPVGFGENVKGVPKDFQHAGQYKEVADSDDWDDKPRSHGILGVLAFLLIIGLIVFFVLGQDGRKRYFRSLRRFINGNGKRRLINSNGFVTYERLRDNTNDLGDVELGDFDSDNSEASDGVRSSGLHTPTANTQTPSSNPMDRNGLIVRSESREFLRTSVPGKRSKTGSPTRGRSPLTMLTVQET